jgi:hypothetical protein
MGMGEKSKVISQNESPTPPLSPTIPAIAGILFDLIGCCLKGKSSNPKSLDPDLHRDGMKYVFFLILQLTKKTEK